MTEQLDPAREFAGIPAQRVRNLLRWLDETFEESELVHRFNHPADEAAALCQRLEREGLLERAGKLGEWRITSAGERYGQGRFTRRYRRTTAERALSQLVARAQALEGDDHPFAFRVLVLRVFGSYLTDAPTLGDLDVGYLLADRYADPDQQAAAEQARRATAGWGASYFRMVMRPEDEVLQHLRQRQAIFALSNMRRSPDFFLGISGRNVYVLPAALRLPWPGERQRPTLQELGIS